MIGAKLAPQSNPDGLLSLSNSSSNPHSPRSRSSISSQSSIPIGDTFHPQSSRTNNTRFFCFVFLLATSSLVFLQVLFHTGYTGSYWNPVICEPSCEQRGTKAEDMIQQQRRMSYPEGSRVRFPRTKRRLPQCIIVGVRKCGTRALLEFLNLHPMIQKAAEEVHFFDDDSKYSLGLDWYRRKMPYSFPGQITVEKSPAYFITSNVPARIHLMDPSINLLLIVRDPVTRLISDYAQLASNKARKDRAVASFENLVLRSDGTVNTGYKAVRISMYSLFFRKWLRTFNRSQIHIVDGDRLVIDPFAEIQEIERFLGLSHKVKKSNFYYNETKGFFCVRNATAEKCLNESKGRKHPHVSSEVVSTLRKFYEPHNRHFYRQAGVNFSWPTN